MSSIESISSDKKNRRYSMFDFLIVVFDDIFNRFFNFCSEAVVPSTFLPFYRIFAISPNDDRIANSFR